MNQYDGEMDSCIEYFRLFKNEQERKRWELNSQAHQLHSRTVNTPPFYSFLPVNTGRKY